MDDIQKTQIKSSLESILGKSISDQALSRIVSVIEIHTADPKPETILTCSRCGKSIIAYGTNGEAFITEHTPSLKYQHINKPECTPKPMLVSSPGQK